MMRSELQARASHLPHDFTLHYFVPIHKDYKFIKFVYPLFVEFRKIDPEIFFRIYNLPEGRVMQDFKVMEVKDYLNNIDKNDIAFLSPKPVIVFSEK